MGGSLAVNGAGTVQTGNLNALPSTFANLRTRNICHVPTIRIYHIRWSSSSLRNNFSRIELNQHSAIGLKFFDRDRKAEVVEKEELKFEMIELC